jgi:aryl-alcohol dehydrogenase-like predicted oxidoreductase
MTRDYEADTLPAIRALGIGFVAYYALGRGFFSGAITAPPEDNRRSVPRFSQENLPRNLEKLNALKEMAASKGCTPGQIALAWVMHQGDFIVPIPGTNSLAHLEENTAAAELTLSSGDLAQLDALFPRDAGLVGARFDRDRSGELNI